MMELFTRRRPTGLIEENGVSLTLQQLVEKAIANGRSGVLQVADSGMNLVSDAEEGKLVRVMELALSCTRFAAEDRPTMNGVLSSLLKLVEAKDND